MTIKNASLTTQGKSRILKAQDTQVPKCLVAWVLKWKIEFEDFVSKKKKQKKTLIFINQ